MTKLEVIKKLNLAPLEGEGGWFRRTWQSPIALSESLDNSLFKAPKYVAASAIYYLLGAGDVSAMHAISASDEVWHFYSADKPEVYLKLVVVNPQTFDVSVYRLGADLEAGQVPQVVVPSGFFMGAKMVGGDKDSWVLCGTCVSPSFEYQDFIKGDAEFIASKVSVEKDFIRALG